MVKAYKLNLLLKNKSKVLDIGCGDGKILSFLKKRGHEVVGTEYDTTYKKKISNKKKIVIYSNNKALKAKKKYDLIILTQVLPHLEDANKIIIKIRNSLKNSGTVYISMPNFSSIQSKLTKSSWHHLDIPRHFYHFNEKTFIKYMSRKKFYLKKKAASEYHQIFFGWLQSMLNLFFTEQNLLFSNLSVFKKKLSFYKFLKLIILTSILIPFSILFTLFEIFSLIQPSVTEYFFKKRLCNDNN